MGLMEREENTMSEGQESSPVVGKVDIEIENHNSEAEREKSLDISVALDEEAMTNDTTKIVGDDNEKAREWFASLSTEDQVVALAFRDRGFLAALSRGAISLSCTFIGGSRTTDRHINKAVVDWMAAIPPGCFEEGPSGASDGEQNSSRGDQQPVEDDDDDKAPSPLPDVASDSQEPVVVVEATVEPADEKHMNGSSNNVIGDEDPASNDISATAETGSQDPDVFRIREGSSEGQVDGAATSTDMVLGEKEPSGKEFGDETPVLTEETPYSSSETAPVEAGKKEQILRFVNSVCAVAPAAFELVGAPATSGSVPVVSLLPSYLFEKSGKDALFAFDEIMSSGKFLSGPVRDSWNDAVQSLASGHVPNTPSVSLYMLLLLRFQLSVLESYQRSIAITPETQPSTSKPTLEKPAFDQDANPAAIPDQPLAPMDTQGNAEAITATPSLDIETTTTDVVKAGAPIDSSGAGKEQSVQLLLEPSSHEDIVPRPTTDDIVSLVPSLFKSLNEPGVAKDNTEKIILDLASFMGEWTEADGASDLDSKLTLVNEAVANIIRSLPSIETISFEPTAEDTTMSAEAASEVEPVAEAAEPSDAAMIPEAVADDVSVGAETSPDGTVAAGKKNPKRKKKRKQKRKGGSNPTVTVQNDEAEKAKESVMEEEGEPAVEKIESSTQTDSELREEVPENPAVEENPVVEEDKGGPPTSKADTTSAESIGSERSTADETDNSADSSNPAPKEDDSTCKADATEDGLQISRLEGVGTVVVTPSVAREASETGTMEKALSDDGVQSTSAEENDHEEWETVEVRSRGSRKKTGDRGNHGRHGSHHSQNGGGNKKNKVRSTESRKRTAKRKMVREILHSVLDDVHEQVTRRKQATTEATPRPVPNAWGTANTNKKQTAPTGKVNDAARVQRTHAKEGATMRDILMGNQNGVAPPASPQQVPQRAYADRARQRGLADAGKKSREKSVLGSVSAADQNTAPTLPETLSAVSTVSAFTETPSSTKNLPQPPGAARSEASSSESIEATKAQSNQKQPSKEISLSPPLPTLLGPGNANSATSSVASSLDAPHVVHHNHHSSYPGAENDVGYHLLGVCDRLTRDIAQFMKRREQALSVRRLERGLVLGALQKTLTTIWPVGCTVEMYGSCATDLDLPSSDLDLVVRGVDEAELAAMQADVPSDSRSESEYDGRAVDNDETKSSDFSDSGTTQSPLKSPASQLQFPMVYPPITSNAERVVTLAMELERQPWAVHVKAIPTATVPVIKILADPARLQAATGNSEWLVQQPQPGQSGAMGANDPSDPMQHYPGGQNPMPWRGADVVNGLLKVDITFEGPEHGGIGSTKFSRRVVEEFSKETGLPPDSTPAVQVIMVLKELLAQRRLNEPFSGGLSSYALLLLVISVVRERAIIRKELERVERQRKLVAAGGGNAIPRAGLEDANGASNEAFSNTKEAVASDPKSQGKNAKHSEKTKSKSAKQNGEKNASKGSGLNTQRKEAAASKKDSSKNQVNQAPGDQKSMKGGTPNDAATLKRGESASSSWASIARKNSTASSQKTSPDSVEGNASSEGNKVPPPKKMGSFAEAVAKGASTTPSNGGSQVAPKKNDGKAQGGHAKKGKVSETSEKTKSDANTKSNPEQSKVSTLPATAPPFEPSNAQSYNGSVPTKQNASLADDSASFFPQSFHDVIEVLCSGETTPGKLLMHFLLFYGQHFDSQSTAIDYSNTHERDANANNGYAVSSPYLQRRNTGSYDPMTGMFTVDPIVVYDPLEGAETNNVARSCFAWSSIRWVFAQSYMTLASAVEMSAGHVPSSQGNGRGVSSTQAGANNAGQNEFYPSGQQDAVWGNPYGHDESGNIIFDPSRPLLELLLSF